MKKEEVKEFIESIKEPEKFLEYCGKLHETEQDDPRDIAYIVSVYLAKHPDIYFKLAGAWLIVMTWNVVRFRSLKREDKAKLKEKLGDDILDAYRKCEEKLRKFEGKSLLDLDLDDNEIKEDIKSIFSEFSSKKSIEFTGASKILHILNPHVFMMWDASIREAYHKLHNKGHKKADPECYLEFLKQSQDIIRNILNKEIEEDLWSKHLTFLDESFMKAFSFKESILKMLDECNFYYIKIRGKVKKNEI